MELDKPNFSEALYSLKAGFKISRKVWSGLTYLDLYKDKVLYIHIDHEEISVDLYEAMDCDLLAEDWYIYEDSGV